MLYDYQCKSCGTEKEAVSRIADRFTNAPVCCDEKMTLFIKQAPMGYVDREVRYICPVTNSEVTTRRARNEIMARNNLIDANDLGGSFQQREKEKARYKQSLDKPPEDLSKEMSKIFKQEQDKFLKQMA